MSDTTTGTITDEGVERLRARIGVPEPWTRRPHYLRPNTDAFRIVAESYGDDNPLWGDPEYATKSVWGGPLAPPPLVGGDSLIGEDEVTAVPDDQRDLMKGDPLRGVHAFYSASAREWWAPLRADRRVWRRNAMVAVLDKPSEFAERAVHEWSANVFRDDEGTMLSGQYRLMIRTERSKAREKKKYDAIEIAQWTEDQIAELDAEYASYRRRGAEPRYWDDVDEGDTIGPLVKGPMLVTDMVCWHVGMGMGLYDVKPLALGVANRPMCSNASTGIPSGRGVRATPPPTTTAACARRGSSTSAPTGWATTRGSGSSTASSASSTTSATRNGCAAL